MLTCLAQSRTASATSSRARTRRRRRNNRHGGERSASASRNDFWHFLHVWSCRLCSIPPIPIRVDPFELSRVRAASNDLLYYTEPYLVMSVGIFCMLRAFIWSTNGSSSQDDSSGLFMIVETGALGEIGQYNTIHIIMSTQRYNNSSGDMGWNESTGRLVWIGERCGEDPLIRAQQTLRLRQISRIRQTTKRRATDMSQA